MDRDALERAADILAAASHVVALTGAGISKESGIPTFRGPDGLWPKRGEPRSTATRSSSTTPRSGGSSASGSSTSPTTSASPSRLLSLTPVTARLRSSSGSAGCTM